MKRNRQQYYCCLQWVLVLATAPVFGSAEEAALRLVGEVENIQIGLSCDNGKDLSSALLTIRVEKLIEYTHVGTSTDQRILPRQLINASASVDDLKDLSRSLGSRSGSWYFQLEGGNSPSCWRLTVSQEKLPIALLDSQTDHSASLRKRADPITDRVVNGELHTGRHTVCAFVRGSCFPRIRVGIVYKSLLVLLFIFSVPMHVASYTIE